MKRVESLQEYYRMVQEAKDRCGRLDTNNFLYPVNVDRYINLQRFYVEKNEAGIIFYSDEERYYQVYYYINGNLKFEIKPKEKPLLMQNIYQEDRKKPEIANIEVAFRESGFILKDRMRHAVFEGWNRWEEFQKASEISRRIMEKKGFRYISAGREQLQRVLEFIGTIKEIPFYQIPYYTEQEYVEASKEGRLCSITDTDGKIVAARYLTINGRKTYGWVGITEEYKNMHGMVLVFLCQALRYVHKNELKMCSWVDENNVASVKYHEHIGSVWTGHMEDEWLLE